MEFQKQYNDIYNKYRNQIYFHIYKKVHNIEDAEDLTHEAFIKSMNHMEKKGIQEGVQALLYFAANSVISNFFQNKKRNDAITSHAITIYRNEVSNDFDTNLLFSSSLKAISPFLTKTENKILLLLEKDLTTKEMQDELGLSMDYIRRKITHLRKLLKDTSEYRILQRKWE